MGRELLEFLERLGGRTIDLIERDLARRERCERGQQRIERSGNVGKLERAGKAFSEGFERVVILERNVCGRALTARKVARDRGRLSGAGRRGEIAQRQVGVALEPRADSRPIDEGRRQSRQRRERQGAQRPRSAIGRMYVSCPKPRA